MTFPSCTETVSLLVARTEGNGELPVPGGDWEVDGRQLFVKVRLCLIDKCHRNQCTVKVIPFHGLRRALTRSKGVAGHQGSSRIPRSIHVFALCKFAGWPVNGTSGLETSLKLSFFFKGTRQTLARSTPSSLGLNTVSTETSSSLAHGEVAQGLEGRADVPCSC